MKHLISDDTILCNILECKILLGMHSLDFQGQVSSSIAILLVIVMNSNSKMEVESRSESYI